MIGGWVKKMTIPVLVFESKREKGRYLSNGIDCADTSHVDGDVNDLKMAMMIWRLDHQVPTKRDLKENIDLSREHKKSMHELYGDEAIVNFDMDLWLELYDPVVRHLDFDTFKNAREWDQ